MFYLDASVLVAAVSREAGTPTAQEWLASANDIFVSDWLITEAAAAVSLKRRMDVISAADQAAALAGLNRQVQDALQLLPVTREDFRTATRYVERAETGLRAGDALHLAVAAAANATLVTFDRKQARGGEMLGLNTLLLA
jgi:predicted nucleic acid-binding protein